MHNRFKPLHGAFLSVSLFTTSAQATTVNYEVENLFGNTYEYSYRVTNNSHTEHLDEFAVYFTVDLFENLRMPGAPTTWDPIAIQPDSVLVADGYYDALAVVEGIPLGDSLGGFTVWADYLGAGSPGSQRFDVFDSANFNQIDSGFTAPFTNTVSEPRNLFIVVGGLLMLGTLARKRRCTEPFGFDTVNALR